MEDARDHLENPLDGTHHDPIPRPLDVPEEKQKKPGVQAISPRSSSSYTIASDQSMFSRDVDHWINGSYSPTETTGVQGSRTAVIQRSTLTVRAYDHGMGVWYFLAMLLPLFNVNNIQSWRCSPSTILNTAEIFLSHIGRICSRVRRHIRSLAETHISRQIFAAAMDMVLVVYAMGFLVLSMYQAELIA